jgi:PAP2 superfamily
MPSLHFGYSLMIGLSIMKLPLSSEFSKSSVFLLPLFNHSHPSLAPRIAFPSSRRLLCIAIGVLYPLTILIAIIATANHFILDAVVGALVCWAGLKWNEILLNLQPLEDYFLAFLRIHKPELLDVTLRPDMNLSERNKREIYEHFATRRTTDRFEGMDNIDFSVTTLNEILRPGQWSKKGRTSPYEKSFSEKGTFDQ